MKKEDLQAALEAIGKSSITVNGDLVVEKHVEYEVANVETGGIGIQIVHHTATADAPQEKKQISTDELTQAIENCQQYFWANSAYAVLYCIIRDFIDNTITLSGFERMIGRLQFSKRLSHVCHTGTIANAFSDNEIYKYPVEKWQSLGAAQRVLLLVEKLRKELKL